MNMRRINRVAAAVMLSLVVVMPCLGQSTAVQRNIDLPKSLGHCDMLWDRMPARWQEGAFIGNGLVGMMLYGNGSGMRLDVSRTDVFDHRAVPTDPPNVGAFLHCRLPVGHFELQPVGKILSVQMRLNLYDAELTGRLTTDRGAINFRLLAPSTADATLLLDTDTEGAEKAFAFTWHPGISASPRIQMYTQDVWLKRLKLTLPEWKQRYHLEDYQPNPPATAGESQGVHWSAQSMTAGGGYVTAWRDDAAASRRDITVSTGYSTQSESAAHDAALAALTPGLAAARATTIQSHRDWWHDYWPQSFISIPDDRLAQFYWIQQYKLASATRPGRPLLDLYGPWFPPSTPWPYYCWNMNVQVAYSSLYTANRLKLGENLATFLKRNEANLAANVNGKDELGIGRATGIDGLAPVTNELGNLPWALHNLYRQFTYAGDDEAIVQQLYPLLTKSMNVYLHRLTPDKDGKLHLPVTLSPEYGAAPDCNYDLSLLNWGLGVLIRYAGAAHASPTDITHWTQVLENLTPYPTDQNGLMIGQGVPLARAHRHYSHLMMIFPLRTMDPTLPKNRALIQASLAHWMTVPGGGRLGFTYAGAASIAAILGDGNQALGDINAVLDKLIFANTMYAEGCIESPLGLCESFQNLLLESNDRGINVFPAVPETWPKVCFADLRAQGAFLVSAQRTDGKNAWVCVKSEKGKPLVIRPGFASQPQYYSDDPRAIVRFDGDTATASLAAGKSLVFYAGDKPSQLLLESCAYSDSTANHYGVRGNRADARH